MLVAMRALRDWRPEKPGERELASAEAGCGSLWSRVTARCQPPGADILRCEPRPRSPGHQYSEGAGPDRAGAFYLVSASSVSRLSFLSLASANFTTSTVGNQDIFTKYADSRNSRNFLISVSLHWFGPRLVIDPFLPAGLTWSAAGWNLLNTILCSVSR